MVVADWQIRPTIDSSSNRVSSQNRRARAGMSHSAWPAFIRAM
jgi:hypothetical protein